ncbi:hypothetical protein EK904_000271 [Melospiza melodia maxima]|nr:hypothetical protein EK904_000271 [Melospiza melodia maxima]
MRAQKLSPINNAADIRKKLEASKPLSPVSGAPMRRVVLSRMVKSPRALENLSISTTSISTWKVSAPTPLMAMLRMTQ